MYFWNKAATKREHATGTDGRLDVSARASPRAYYACRDAGALYTWTSSYVCAANDYALYVRNTSSVALNMGQLWVSGGANVRFDALFVTGTATGTPAGGTNHMRSASPNVEDADAYGSAKVNGLTPSASLGIFRVPANASRVFFEDACLMVMPEQAIAIKCLTAGQTEFSFVGYFE